jgi:parallel beta-helix repeat protein
MRTLGLLIALTLVTLTGVAEGITLSCGQTLGPSSGTFLLDSDVGPCDDVSAAITLVGPVRLDLNGHTVSCQDLNGDTDVPIGIALQGSRTLARNGAVDGCSIGVSLVGSNGRIESIALSANDLGVAVEGDFNVLTRNSVDDGTDTSFVVIGNRNLLHENVAAHGIEGFFLLGDNNNLRGNIAEFNFGAGFDLHGFRATLVENVAQFVGAQGFNVSSNGCLMRNNEAVGNAGEGFFLVTNTHDCILRFNSAEGNAFGIRAATNTLDNAITGNTALGNTIFDLKDDNGNCTANLWQGNVFGTKDPDCIQ